MRTAMCLMEFNYLVTAVEEKRKTKRPLEKLNMAI